MFLRWSRHRDRSGRTRLYGRLVRTERDVAARSATATSDRCASSFRPTSSSGRLPSAAPPGRTSMRCSAASAYR